MRMLNQTVRHKLASAMVCLLAAAPFFLIYKELVSPRMAPLLLKRNIVSTMPEVSLMPQPIADLTPSKAAGTVLTFYGNTFQVPWREIIGRRIVRETAVMTFAPRIGIMIWSPTSQEGSLIAGRPYYSASAHTSYAEESTVLDMTPSQIRFFDPPQVSAARVSLLLRKAMTLSGGPGLRTGFYRFQTAEIRGFQIGDPAQSSQVRLDMFDRAGNSLGEILFVFGKNASARGSQADLNRIIQSFRPVANAASSSARSRNLLAR